MLRRSVPKADVRYSQSLDWHQEQRWLGKAERFGYVDILLIGFFLFKYIPQKIYINVRRAIQGTDLGAQAEKLRLGYRVSLTSGLVAQE